ncbi:class I SAM-dependent methyltransferase [Oxalobacter vibrioformis]|uniref:Class I SAM-dependent methyltransferase n=1 Tax=Oxalobacter vibrioformis TaxID=933080 RepID=A0A9E9P2D6_9BURK|nr:class I SAM-dependent methyltransferase [Oxalobacter vibrioformis]WAW09105.1 class I SAM-dependent methyltransferase [Oxalobacter vibrioformis]
MNEASKTRRVRAPDFEKKYLSGRVIDIGAGADLVCPTAESFDKDDGDANSILDFFSENTFDCVHSSHCLEHMDAPEKALHEWWKLVKPGGYMIIVVPDEYLYEQGFWPSMFNTDHKFTFRIGGSSQSRFSIDIKLLCEALINCEIIQCKRQTDNYNHNLIFDKKNRPREMKNFIIKKMISLCYKSPLFINIFGKWLVNQGYPLDQTMGHALAQIEIIMKKSIKKFPE